MRHLNATAKHNARLALRTSWGKAVAMVLLLLAVTTLFGFFETLLTVFFDIPGFVDILVTPGYYLDNVPNGGLPSLAITSLCGFCAFMVLSPLTLGVTNWYYRLTYGHSEEFGSIFTFFESPTRLIKALWLRFSVGLRTSFWTILFLFPSALLCFMGSHLVTPSATQLDHAMATIGITIGAFLGFVGLALSWIVCNRYFLVPYLICDNPTLKVSKAIKLSVLATRGRKTDLAVFQLSFFWWKLASLLVLPALYLQPYEGTSMAIYARYLMELEELTLSTQQDISEEPEAYPIDAT